MSNFTIRFKSEYDIGSNSLVVGCDKYNTYQHSTGVIEVVAYPTISAEAGVTYYVGSAEDVVTHNEHFGHDIEYFNIAFVSNANSKTIDKIC